MLMMSYDETADGVLCDVHQSLFSHHQIVWVKNSVKQLQLTNCSVTGKLESRTISG